MRCSVPLALLLATIAMTTGCAVLPPESHAVWVDDYCDGGCDQGCACNGSAGQEWPADPGWDKFDRCAKRGFNKAFRPDLGYEPPPAVPLTPSTPGRFFPAPSQPAFAPRL